MFSLGIFLNTKLYRMNLVGRVAVWGCSFLLIETLMEDIVLGLWIYLVYYLSYCTSATSSRRKLHYKYNINYIKIKHNWAIQSFKLKTSKLWLFDFYKGYWRFLLVIKIVQSQWDESFIHIKNGNNTTNKLISD